MEDIKRIMMECRFLLSLNKNYDDLSKKFNVSKEDIYDDLNIKLKNYDTILYKRVIEKLRKI